jgi:chemotaxis protein methyltransferase CheR
MSWHLSEDLLAQVSEAVADRIGLHFPETRWRDLERGLENAAREMECPDAAAFCRWLLSSPLTRTQIERLASALTVGETYFFREPRSFDILRESLLPPLIHTRRDGDRRLRFWSAGCCTGEEPYSLAILLDSLIPDLKDWHVTILATDINPRFLQKASEGVYSAWSFRGTPSWVSERYFRKTADGHFALLPRIKRMVTFSVLNLADDGYPSLATNTSAMDAILCRNVLMYFAPGRLSHVVQGFHRSLIDGGWLMVSPTEISHEHFTPFATAHFPGAVLYRKTNAIPPPPADMPAWRMDPAPAPAPPAGPVPEPATMSPFFLPVHTPSFPAEDIPSPAASPDALTEEARSLYEGGRYDEAEARLVRALSLRPGDGAAMALLARVCANRGRLGPALDWCERALAADTLNAGLHYLHAMILQESGTLAEAEQALRRALYLDPDFVLAHVALGNLAQRRGKAAAAVRHFENGLALLSACPPEAILSESDGLTAGRLREIIHLTTSRRDRDERKPGTIR